MAKRKNDFYSLKNLIPSFINANNLSYGIYNVKLKDAWLGVMGRGVASHTLSVELQKTTLLIRLTSSVLREELGYKKEKIIKMLNDEVGDQVVSKLLLL